MVDTRHTGDTLTQVMVLINLRSISTRVDYSILWKMPGRGWKRYQKKWNALVDMPHLRTDVLLEQLRDHAMELHDIYVQCKDITLSQRILDEVLVIERMIKQIETLI